MYTPKVAIIKNKTKWVSGVRCQVPGIRCRVPGAGCRVPGIGYRVSGVGCRVPGIGYRVIGAGDAGSIRFMEYAIYAPYACYASYTSYAFYACYAFYAFYAFYTSYAPMPLCPYVTMPLCHLRPLRHSLYIPDDIYIIIAQVFEACLFVEVDGFDVCLVDFQFNLTALLLYEF